MRYADITRAAVLIKELNQVEDDLTALATYPEADLRVFLEWGDERGNLENYSITFVEKHHIMEILTTRKVSLQSHLHNLGAEPDHAVRAFIIRESESGYNREPNK